jgi:hypothetical protein
MSNRAALTLAHTDRRLNKLLALRVATHNSAGLEFLHITGAIAGACQHCPFSIDLFKALKRLNIFSLA